jgi:hypothetical protein
MPESEARPERAFGRAFVSGGNIKAADAVSSVMAPGCGTDAARHDASLTVH